MKCPLFSYHFMVLPAGLQSKRFKAPRFRLIRLAGQVRERSRQLQILLDPKQPGLEILQRARGRIAELARALPPESRRPV